MRKKPAQPMLSALFPSVVGASSGGDLSFCSTACDAPPANTRPANQPDAREALRMAIGCVGSQRLLAEQLGLKQGQVSVWLNRDGRVPAERVLAVESATGGQVSRYALRPDIYGLPPSTGQLFYIALQHGWRQYKVQLKQAALLGGILAIGVLIAVLGGEQTNTAALPDHFANLQDGCVF